MFVCQADYALNTLASAVGYTQEVHEKNLGTYNGAKEQYFGLVEGAVKYTKQVLDPNPYIKKVESTAKWAGATAASYVDPDKIVDTGAEYAMWASSFGPGEGFAAARIRALACNAHLLCTFGPSKLTTTSVCLQFLLCWSLASL